MLNNLRFKNKNELWAASAYSIKMVMCCPKVMIRYNNLHTLASRATPNMFCENTLSFVV
jgi:hypothetical protein